MAYVAMNGWFGWCQGGGKFLNGVCRHEQQWSYIPFTFVGAIDNTASIESAPLLELADLNLAHYIDSADFQESVYFVGQPQFYMENVDQQMYETIKKDGLYIGCKNAFPVKLGFAQANPNTLSQTAMDKKWEQMKENELHDDIPPFLISIS